MGEREKREFICGAEREKEKKTRVKLQQQRRQGRGDILTLSSQSFSTAVVHRKLPYGDSSCFPMKNQSHFAVEK